MGYELQGFKDKETVLSATHFQNIEAAILNNEANISSLQENISTIVHPLYGLNVLCLGDSITYGQGMTTETRWANVMAQKYNWNLTVQAAGGISLSSYYYTVNSKSDVSINKKAEKIAAMEIKPDIVLVWGGHNDASYRYSPLGSWNDIDAEDTKGVIPTYADKNSFKGALRYIAELVHYYAPKATLFMLTREWNKITPSALIVPEGTTDTGADFDKAIVEGAYLYGWVPINMQLCGINPYTKDTYTSDGTHPNASGTELIVNYLSSELAKHYRVPDLSKVSVESIELNKGTTTILSGKTEALITKVSPSNATNTSTLWASSNDNIATVNSSGLVTAVSEGATTITAKTIDGGLIASCIVNVSNTAVVVTGITLDKTQHTCQQSTEFTLEETILPSNATNQNILWNSSNEEIAIVTGGFVKALREGNVIITATTEDGGFKATCNVTVTV